MAHLQIATSQGPVKYHVYEGCLKDAPRLLAEDLAQGRPFVLCDEAVVHQYGQSLAAALDAPLLAMPAGESAKSWSSVERVVRFLLGHGAERRDFLVVMGGGVMTDLGGFAASLYMRGIRWVAAPTTLVGMVDAAVGGKTGIDLPEGKNLLGTFWQPRMVLADPLTLATLPRRELKAGLAEVIKAALIAPSSLEHLLDERLPRLVQGNFLSVAPLLAQAVKVKAEVVELDERDQSARACLNLGHTLGHALEAATGYGYFLHGEAVAWGLLYVLLVARGRGFLAAAEAGKWAARLELLAPLPRIEVSLSSVRRFFSRDKKRDRGQVRWVLPRYGGVVLGVELDPAEERDYWQQLLELPAEGPFTPHFV